MNNNLQTIPCVLAVLVAVCAASCDKQSPKSDTAASSKKTNQTRISQPANLKPAKESGSLMDAKTALKHAASTHIMWSDVNAESAKHQLEELVELHKAMSETPTYENALVSADFELKLCNNIVPALIGGYLSSGEARSMLAVVTANRFSKSSLITMLSESAPDSKQARILIAGLQSGKPVNLVEASDALLREQGASFLDVPTPDSLGELLDKPNPARAFQYHMMGAAKLDVANVIAEYASIGGDLKADDSTLAASLQKKVPQLINAPGQLTNRPMDVPIVVDFLRDWRNGTFPQ